MQLLEQLQEFINNLDQRQFYLYISGILGTIVLLLAFILYWHYSSMSELNLRIESINEYRQEAEEILAKYQQVKKQQKDVNAMLAEDPNFKIAGFFDALLAKLGLSNKKDIATTSSIDRENNYRESILSVKFTGINMKELCELLNELEQTKRIFTKELDITKSKKLPNMLDVNLTFATLQPKSLAS